jgi:hypothetical protein
LLNAGQQRPALRRERGEAAVGGVDVQPQRLGGADIGEVGQGVDGARAGRSSGGAHGEGDPAGTAVGAGGGSHCRRLQPPVIIGRQDSHLVGTQAHRPRGPG